MHASYFLNKSFWACQTIPRCEFRGSWEFEKTDNKEKALVWPLPFMCGTVAESREERKPYLEMLPPVHGTLLLLVLDLFVCFVWLPSRSWELKADHCTPRTLPHFLTPTVFLRNPKILFLSFYFILSLFIIIVYVLLANKDTFFFP